MARREAASPNQRTSMPLNAAISTPRCTVVDPRLRHASIGGLRDRHCANRKEHDGPGEEGHGPLGRRARGSRTAGTGLSI